MKNIAVFISGGGTNLQALIDAERAGKIPGGKISLVVSSNDHAFGLQRAAGAGIKTAVFSKKSYESLEARDTAILKLLEDEKIDYIVLGAYLGMLTPVIFNKYKNKIINIHPSLIPSFCGKGFFGLKVHEAAIEYGVKVTGATVHFVDEEYDHGAVILQEAVEVRQDDTPETLQKRVLEIEHKLYPEAVRLLVEGRLSIEGRRVVLK